MPDPEPLTAGITQADFLEMELGSSYPPQPTEADEARIRRTTDSGTRALKSPPRADVNLNVPYIHQRHDTPADFHGGWACGPTSVAMVLAYYELIAPRPISLSAPIPHESPYGWYVANEFSHGGRTFDKTAQTPWGPAKGLYGSIVDLFNGRWLAGIGAPGSAKGVLPVLESFMAPMGNRVEVIHRPTPEAIVASLDDGHPVVLSGDVFTWGHLLVVRGYYRDDSGRLHWIVNDPDGFKVAAGYDGENVVYEWEEIHDPRGANGGRSKYMFRIRGAHRPGGGGETALSLDSPVLGAPTGDRARVAAYLKRLGGHEYTAHDTDLILGYYWRFGPEEGVDPFLAVMQSIYDTGAWRAPEAGRPHRNPARLGRGGAPGGVQSFPSWEQSAKAHIEQLKAQGDGKRLRDLRGDEYAQQVVTTAKKVSAG